MKQTLIALSSLLAFLLAGCASQPQQVAEYQPCKVARIPAASIDGYGGGPSKKPVDKLDQDYALLQLQATPYYRQQLQRRGYGNSTIVDGVRDCY